jgi:uncharacterized protein (DUF3820 family)
MNNKTELNLIKGLKKHNITYEMIKDGTVKYCGGNKGSHLNYFKIFFTSDRELPKPEDKCICGHFIVDNCYITDGKEIIVLGNCCIKRFVPKCGRTCEKCGENHKNRKNNLCNKCRIHHPTYNIIYKQNIYISNNHNDKLPENDDELVKKYENEEIKFGKHKGTKYKDLPTHYKMWLVNNNVISHNQIARMLKLMIA